VSLIQSTDPNGAFLAPEPLEAIQRAQTLLIEAEISARVREFQYPETREYERLGFELSKALTLARVSIGMALTSEAEEES
jgi:hypothetical protein